MINTLQVYREALKAGFDEKQAEFQAEQLLKANEAHPDMATKADIKALELATNDRIKDEVYNLKIFFVYLVGGALFFGLFLPVFQRYLGLS